MKFNKYGVAKLYKENTKPVGINIGLIGAAVGLSIGTQILGSRKIRYIN